MPEKTNWRMTHLLPGSVNKAATLTWKTRMACLLRELVKELVQHALEHLHIVLVVLSRLRAELDAGVHLARGDCDGKNGECNVRIREF